MSVFVSPLIDIEDDDWLGPAAVLIADEVQELHTFAAHIHLSKWRFRPSPPAIVPHYRLTAGKRNVALANGALDADVEPDLYNDCRLLWRLMTARRFLLWRTRRANA